MAAPASSFGDSAAHLNFSPAEGMSLIAPASSLGVSTAHLSNFSPAGGMPTAESHADGHVQQQHFDAAPPSHAAAPPSPSSAEAPKNKKKKKKVKHAADTVGADDVVPLTPPGTALHMPDTGDASPTESMSLTAAPGALPPVAADDGDDAADQQPPSPSDGKKKKKKKKKKTGAAQGQDGDAESALGSSL
jgi:hypothetical protein